MPGISKGESCDMRTRTVKGSSFSGKKASKGFFSGKNTSEGDSSKGSSSGKNTREGDSSGKNVSRVVPKGTEASKGDSSKGSSSLNQDEATVIISQLSRIDHLVMKNHCSEEATQAWENGDQDAMEFWENAQDFHDACAEFLMQ